MRRLITGIVVPLLLIGATACGGGGAADTPKDKLGTIADITVTGSPEATPKIDFNAPLKFDESQREVIERGPGTGDAVNQTSLVTMDYLGVNASDGATVDSSYEAGDPATFKPADTIKGLAAGLKGAQADDRVLITVTSQDGYDPTGNQTTVRPGDSLIFVVDVIKVANPSPIPESQLPTIENDKDGNPDRFVAKADTPTTVGLLGSYVVKKGDGPKLKADDTVPVKYLGQLWPDGTVFDNSYSKKKPVEVQLTNAVDGFKQGLIGTSVGSRVILTIPSDLAYGSTGRGGVIPPDSDLIFLIDIVDAK